MGRVSDTREEAEQVRLAAIRARSPEQRLRDAMELSEMVHAAAMAKLRARYPTRSTLELVPLLSEGAVQSPSVPR